ncbi:MAG: hypothetical protein ACFFDN_11580, partial [Candidatus Hodarchaeota archaeon]
KSEFPIGYICKKIRKEDNEVVDIFYKSFKEMVDAWEKIDYIRDKYVVNPIKSIIDENEAVIDRNLTYWKKKYNIKERLTT